MSNPYGNYGASAGAPQSQGAGGYSYYQYPAQQTTPGAAAAAGAATTGYSAAGYGYGGGYAQPQQQQQQVQQVQQAQPVVNSGLASAASPHATPSGGQANASNWNYGVPQQQQQQQLYGGAAGSLQAQSSGNHYAPPGPMNNNVYDPSYAAAAAAPSTEPAPAATNRTDDDGLRWTWSAYPNTGRVKTKEHLSVSSIPLPEMLVPMSCMYAPLHPIPVDHMVMGEPDAPGQRCVSCGAYWNVHSQREEGRFWVCLSCLRRNPLPQGYSPQHPALLHQTVEYILPHSASPSANSAPLPPGAQPQGLGPHAASHPYAASASYPVFVFVVDLCLLPDELAALKTRLIECLPRLPPKSLVGLVTFGAHTQIWDLGCMATLGMPKCVVLRGEAPYTAEMLGRMLNISAAEPVLGHHLVPVDVCEFALTSLLEDLQPDNQTLVPGRRPLRTTGTAVAAATFVMEALTFTGESAAAAATSGGIRAALGVSRGAASPHATPAVEKVGKIMLFTSGPCTRGNGAIVSTEKTHMIRFHRDIIGGDTPYYKQALEFYNGLESRLAAMNVCLDVFSESFDQIGTMEMRNCVNNTGGTFICGDCFSDDLFKESLARYFERCDLRLTQQGAAHSATSPGGGHGEDTLIVRCAFGVRLELYTSADTLCSGILGPATVDAVANKAAGNRAVSPVVIGVGGTTRWSVSTLDQAVTLAYLFDTATLDGGAGGAAAAGRTGSGASRRFIQFVVRYVTPHGQRRVRITSVVQPVAPTMAPPSYYTQAEAFDQTCASTIIARMGVSILEQHPTKWEETKRWLDTLLVRFVRRYGTFQSGVPDSLQLAPCLALFPSFMFNLRRSEYFMLINISPDETTFKRHWLMREPVDNCVLMIQPTLDSYDIESPYAEPVPLDSSSLRHDNIVLMDAFFNVHIMWGATIFEWIEAKYQDNPEYAYFAELLEAAEVDARAILAQRYPYPRFSRTDANGSEARHVKTRVNPATTYAQVEAAGGGGGGLYGGGGGAAAQGQEAADVIYTDDVSIVKFMQSLKKAVVQNDTPKAGQAL